MKRSRLACALAAAALPCVVLGQEAPPPPGAPVPGAELEALARPRIWLFTPRLSVREDYSDNVRQEPAALAQSGWVTGIVPGLRLDHEGPRLRLNADYSYDRTWHHGASDLDVAQNFLTATGAYNVYERNVAVEARASISQENRSAFAAPVIPGSPSSSNQNRAETRLLGVSPIVRGQFGDVAIWRVRYNETEVRTREDFVFAATQLRTSELVAGARSAAAAARLGWNLEATALRSRADTTGSVEDKRIRADLVFGLAPQLHVLLIEGYEKTDFTREGTTTGTTPGAGIEWSAGPRTQLAAVVQKRFFGTGHLASFVHRSPRMALRLGSTKDSTVLTSVLGATAGTLQSLMENLLASAIPDPIARSEAARERLAELGSAPTTVSTGFLTERPFVYSQQDASLTYITPRSTLAMSYQRRVQDALGQSAGLGDSFTLSEEIHQRYYRVGWTYQLTRLTSFTAAVSGQHTKGTDASNLSTREDLATFYLSSEIGPRTTGTFGLRRVDFQSNQLPGYRENAVFGSLSFRL